MLNLSSLQSNYFQAIKRGSGDSGNERGTKKPVRASKAAWMGRGDARRSGLVQPVHQAARESVARRLGRGIGNDSGCAHQSHAGFKRPLAENARNEIRKTPRNVGVLIY
jgi:hypothetical protein